MRRRKYHAARFTLGFYPRLKLSAGHQPLVSSCQSMAFAEFTESVFVAVNCVVKDGTKERTCALIVLCALLSVSEGETMPRYYRCRYDDQTTRGTSWRRMDVDTCQVVLTHLLFALICKGFVPSQVLNTETYGITETLIRTELSVYIENGLNFE